jgi:proton-dependent oligopeptide transporter, POT family
MSDEKNNDLEYHDSTLDDVKQLGLMAALGSLGYVFWVVGAMEMVERLAYYGVRAVSSLYVTRAKTDGGLGVSMATFGTLLFTWNMVQSSVSIFTGGFSDRHGYKQTIFVATLLKCLGYLVMAWFATYWGFFAGAMLLALGTAIFKPGIQGTLIRTCTRRNSSVAWGLFYQMVNIGGWIGPLIALHQRQSSWDLVFYINAGVICINFLLLLIYKEPGHEERLERRAQIKAGTVQESHLFGEALQELKKPHLYLYLLIFTVWWFMFPMLWDVLPKYVEDWVDTQTIIGTLFGEGVRPGGVVRFLMGLSEDGTRIEPEGIVNLNSAMIMVTCFIFAGISAKMRATNSLLVGTLLIVVALALFGFSNLAWIGVIAMVIFSVGEMLASPKFSEFLGNIAPPDKKAMWIGFSQAPILIGGTIEGKVGPLLYHHFSSKDTFAREMLLTKGLDVTQVTEAALPPGEAFHKLVEITGQAPELLTRELYQAHNVGTTWYLFAVVGAVAAVLIYLYGRWIFKLAQSQKGAAKV